MDLNENPPAENVKETIDVQLRFLEMEVEHISAGIARIDAMTQTTKNWSIALWAGSIGLALNDTNTEIRSLIWLTAAIPILFWIVDSWWRRIQRSFVYRSERIADFINSNALSSSLDAGRLVDFEVYDPRARQYKDQPEYELFRSSLKTMLFREVAALYIGLIVISLSVGLYFSRLDPERESASTCVTLTIPK